MSAAFNQLKYVSMLCGAHLNHVSIYPVSALHMLEIIAGEQNQSCADAADVEMRFTEVTVFVF